MSEIVTIHTFDDGRGDFKKYINEWIITKKMFNGSKVELTNVHNKKIKISSISSWKTRTIEDLDLIKLN
jgi:hypothetical protein